MDAKRDGLVEFESQRRSGDAELAVCYSPQGRPFNPVPGTLEHFLVERYVLFSARRSGAVLRGDIHHVPWVLRSAKATICRNTVISASGIELPAMQPLLHFAARQDTLIWPPGRER